MPQEHGSALFRATNRTWHPRYAFVRAALCGRPEWAFSRAERPHRAAPTEVLVGALSSGSLIEPDEINGPGGSIAYSKQFATIANLWIGLSRVHGKRGLHEEPNARLFARREIAERLRSLRPGVCRRTVRIATNVVQGGQAEALEFAVDLGRPAFFTKLIRPPWLAPVCR